MLSLPTELWLLIGAYLSQPDLLAAVQVNHTFHSQLNPILYQNFVICGGHIRFTPLFPWRNSMVSTKSRTLSEAQYIERSFATIKRLKRIQCSSVLMNAIKSCTLCHFDHQSHRNEKTIADALEQVLQEAVALISRLPHCCDIVVNVVHISHSQLERLVSHQSRPVNLSIQNSTILDGDSTCLSDSQRQCSLKNLTINSVQSGDGFCEFTAWSIGRDLRSLSFQGVSFQYLTFIHIQLAQKTLPNLRLLTLLRNLDWTQVLACLPMLEELSLSYYFPPLELAPTILPRLRIFEGAGDHVRSIVPGRPIQVLRLRGLDGMLSSSVAHAPNFGSTTPMLELSIRGNPAEVIGLGRITHLCPSLEVLCLSSIPLVPIDANMFTAEYMREIYHLKHLRHLDFQFLYHVPSDQALAWERSMCEAFRTRSAPNIHHVSFSSIVEWNRVPYDTTWIPSGEGVSANLGRNPGENGWPSSMAKVQWPEAPFPVNE